VREGGWGWAFRQNQNSGISSSGGLNLKHGVGLGWEPQKRSSNIARPELSVFRGGGSNSSLTLLK